MSNLRTYLIAILFFLGLLSLIEGIFLMLYVYSVGQTGLGDMFLVAGSIIAFILLLFAGVAATENKNSKDKMGLENRISTDNNNSNELKNNKN